MFLSLLDFLLAAKKSKGAKEETAAAAQEGVYMFPNGDRYGKRLVSVIM